MVVSFLPAPAAAISAGVDAADVPRAAPPAASLAAQPAPRRPWAIALRMTYATPTQDVYGLALDPYRLGLGGMLSYTLPSGLWFGLSGDAYPGRTVSQVYRPPFYGRDVAVDADSQVTSFDGVVGFDLPLSLVALRYSLGVGATILRWDFGDLNLTSLSGFTPMQGSLVALHLKPTLGVVLPVGFWFSAFDVGYRIETSAQVPSALTFDLSMGVRL